MKVWIMSLLEDIKKAGERITGLRRPSAEQLRGLLRAGKPRKFLFSDDGVIPNNPRWPLVLYGGAVTLPRFLDPAAVFEELFASNGWGDSWRDGIYDYLHYHSRIPEVLGIARGTAKVRFGGKNGRTLVVKAGDVAIIPAGTGHQCLSASKTFLVVGAYPRSGTYDECAPNAKDYERAIRSVRKVARPRKDPVFGSKGPLLEIWKTKR
jgi:uncharacterized protein YjlB